MAPPMWLEQSMGIMRASVADFRQRAGGQSALRALFDHAPRRSAGQIRAQQPLAQSGSASLSLEDERTKGTMAGNRCEYCSDSSKICGRSWC
mmetsp:Transcript_6399/g.13378  ORF Transcript_6399/g.13378 Transcript_6399/m.13378 type:complete len:92 (+) Transcript_6399:309-584(+)